MRDTEDRYWFSAKTYGYGWGLPSAWQGWVVLLGYLFVVFAPLALGPEGGLITLGAVVVATPVLVIICYRKGEPAKWRWGGNR